MKENVKQLKDELRAEYKEKRAALSADEKKEKDDRICSVILSLASFRYAKTVLMYAPMAGEIDIYPIAAAALAAGKRVAFPLCNVEEHSMEFKYVTDLSTLKRGHYSIFEPDETDETVTDLSHSVCLIPGMVFDRNGYRVGYGKGYYDRFLNGYGETKIGLIYSDFILDSVPRGRFDCSVDILISERGAKVVDKSSEKKNTSGAGTGKKND